MQVNFKPGNTAVVGGSELELVQFHFHTPSEHTFDGVHTPLEVHLVSCCADSVYETISA